jgi:membrane protein implicated in regulation of membrane protease activity
MKTIFGYLFLTIIITMIIRWFSAGLLAIGEFLLNTWWGFASIICAVLSILFFYISYKIYPQVRARDKYFKSEKENYRNLENFFKNKL